MNSHSLTTAVSGLVNLEALGDTLATIRAEMTAHGMPKTLIERIDAVHSIIPNIERHRERTK